MSISNLTGKRLKCVKQSAVFDHLLDCNCLVDFDHCDILASHANRFRLFIKESVLIKRDQSHLHKNIKSFPLIDFIRVDMLLWNTETDKRFIVVELYQVLNIFYWLVRVFNSSGKSETSTILRKIWISQLDLYLITSDYNDLDYRDVWMEMQLLSGDKSP